MSDDNIIMLIDRLQHSAATDPRLEDFLLNEGLAALAAYRAIQDRHLRLSLLDLMQTIGRTSIDVMNTRPQPLDPQG